MTLALDPAPLCNVVCTSALLPNKWPWPMLATSHSTCKQLRVKTDPIQQPRSPRIWRFHLCFSLAGNIRWRLASAEPAEGLSKCYIRHHYHTIRIQQLHLTNWEEASTFPVLYSKRIGHFDRNRASCQQTSALDWIEVCKPSGPHQDGCICVTKLWSKRFHT